MALYDQIGAGYDATRRADPYITDGLVALLNPRDDGVYLDLACGTGNYTAALAQRGLRLTGIDQSARMIAAAGAKDAAVQWQVGDATALPFAGGTFAGVLCTLALHHFPALEPAFAEVRRVMQAGRFVAFTATAEQTERYWLMRYFPEAMRKSIEQTPRRQDIMDALAAAGFGRVWTEPYAVRDDLRDLFLYHGKRQPERYLDPRLRAGISTFAALASPEEVQAGCERLRAEIDSGHIAEIIASYEHDGGDYLFVVAETT